MPPFPVVILQRGAEEETRVLSFDERFAELFHKHFDRLVRVMDRLSGERTGP